MAELRNADDETDDTVGQKHDAEDHERPEGDDLIALHLVQEFETDDEQECAYDRPGDIVEPPMKQYIMK